MEFISIFFHSSKCGPLDKNRVNEVGPGEWLSKKVEKYGIRFHKIPRRMA
jgi:hypothetical protein